MSVPVVFTPPFKTLVDGVTAYFTANSVLAVVERGWKARAKAINQGAGGANRVIFLPSKRDGGCGKILPPLRPGYRDIGGDPDASPPVVAPYSFRPMFDWERQVIVSVWAVDTTNREDQGLQDDAVYQLFVWTMRAVNSIAFGNAKWGGVEFTVPNERAFGLEIFVELLFRHEMPDLPIDIGTPTPVVNRPPAIP